MIAEVGQGHDKLGGMAKILNTYRAGSGKRAIEKMADICQFMPSYNEQKKKGAHCLDDTPEYGSG